MPRAPGSDVYPYVFTTYRLTEHHTAGGMQPTWNAARDELPFVFVSSAAGLGWRWR